MPPQTAARLETTAKPEATAKNQRNMSEELALQAANAAKQRGNELFKLKDYEGALKKYSEAIELDPSNAVLYSNRSAVYLAKGDAKSKAFRDAETCVRLKPDWAKGHGRLGAAQHALGRFADAQASYLTALSLEESASYRAALEAAKDGERQATQRRIFEEQERERLRAAEEAAAREAAREKEELSGFFDELTNDESVRKKQKKQRTNPTHEKYTTQDLGTDQVARLSQKHHEFRNLNPYLVLQLDVDASPDDIKMRYRKLSTLCHPDKNLDDVERATVAFEAVKAAYQRLSDAKTRDRTILVVEGARSRARQQGLDLDKEVLKTFAQNEMKRRDVESHQRTNAARERAQQDEAKKKEEDEKKFEDEWNADDRRSERVGFWQTFQDDARSQGQKRLRTAKNFRTQHHMPAKFGQVELESWKKDWK